MQFTANQEQKLQDLHSKAQDTANQMSQKAQQIAQDVKERSQEFSHHAQEIVHDVKERAEKLAHQASEKMSEIQPDAIVRDAGEMIKKYPMQSLAAGALLGGLLGMLVARRGRRA